MTDGHLILAAGALLAASVAASLVAAKLRVPALLLFLGVGMAVGSDGARWISFDNYALARELGLAALALILFDGGLNSSFSDVRKVLPASLRLAVGATLIVTIVTAVFASALVGLSLPASFLLGSMLASTDSAAVFGLLRGSTLRRRLVHTMEAEAALNDAVVLVLVIGLVEWNRNLGYGVVDLVVHAAREFGVGAVCGYLVPTAAAAALARVRLPTKGFYAVASFGIAALAYGAAASLNGSGLLAVYVAGLLLAEAQIPGRQTIAVFHDGLAWMAQVGVFLTLGLLVSPGRLGAAIPDGILLAVIVMFVARPLATFAVTTAREFTIPERLVLSWAELLGATPLIFATLAVASAVNGSLAMFDVAFVAVVVSTVVQGLTFEPLAQALGLTRVLPLLPRPLVEFGGLRRSGAEFVEFPVAPDDGVVGLRMRDLALPLGITASVIMRGDHAVPPTPATRLKAGDVLHLLVPDELAARVPDLVARLKSPGTRRWSPRRAAEDVELRELHTQAWTEGDGDPADPDLVSGALVVERLRSRRDIRGALVRLADGRYAVTGATLAVGSGDVLRRYANRRLARAPNAIEASWWGEVVTALRP
jgi:cell volume regulation protein A